MHNFLRELRRRFGFKICLLGVYALAADIMLCVVVLPFQRYALVTARADDSTPSTVLALLVCDLCMLAYVMSGMAANGAVIRFGLTRIPIRRILNKSR